MTEFVKQWASEGRTRSNHRETLLLKIRMELLLTSGASLPKNSRGGSLRNTIHVGCTIEAFSYDFCLFHQLWLVDVSFW